MWRSLVACLVVMSAVPHALASGAGDAAGAAAQPAALTAAEVAARMRALAIKKRDALPGGNPGPASAPGEGVDIPASDACKRPDAARRAAITASVAAWMHGQPATRGAEDPFAIRFGCEEAAGVVVDVQADVLAPHAHQGHWWILRVQDRASGGAIEVLAHERGVALNDFMEWVMESMLHAVTLADLDGDGTLDVISVLDVREGGNPHHDLTLSSILSGTHHRSRIAKFGDAVLGASRSPGEPVVIAIREQAASGHPPRTFYRCIDARPTLLRCDAARRAAQDAARWDAIQRWIDQPPPSIPDRDALADDLAALDAPAAERAQLLASARATWRGTQLARSIQRVAVPEDDRTNTERAAAEHAEAVAWDARLRRALGDASCSLTPAAKSPAMQERLRAWGTSHVPTGTEPCKPADGCRPATQLRIARGCTTARGSYYELEWHPDGSSYGMHRHAVVFSAGDSITPLRDLVVVGDTDPPAAAGEPVDLGFGAVFSRKGDAAVAIVLERTGATAAVDGTVAATLPGEVTRFEVGSGIASDTVLVRKTQDRQEYWHAGAGLDRLGSMAWDLTAPDVQGALPRMLVDRELRRRATDRLSRVDWTSPDATRELYEPSRTELAAALGLLKADPALIAAVKRGP